ncbi:choice-of-anchor Q domain-containing protein [Chiayiivirga flava]|uniref:CSLREA domain-containing protein n=1 Tax=Chiayiivirga flava TaxID=659595 RepID=A0A7W8D486_9GAMM|nr:choice-of-anchor Q domain-containing protein [Chiayiivirga flava]MBB5206490.1 hypothetical protein [Chiayiivirga flava]
MPHRLVFAIVLAVLSAPATAATFVVQSIDDSGPGTLRQAMLDANAAPLPPHRIEFGDGFPVGGLIELFSGLPPLEVAVEIDGAGRTPGLLPFDASSSFRFFRTGSSLTLRGMALSSGRGEGDAGGGCVLGQGLNEDSVLVLDTMTFTGCTAVAYGAGEWVRGGAVAWRANAPVFIVDSVFQGNGVAALGGGEASGGAVSVNGPLQIESSYFFSNLANGDTVFGGAVQRYAQDAPVRIVDSVFVGNRAVPEPGSPFSGSGGALSLDCETCSVQLERVFFGDNRSDNGGAAMVRGNSGIATTRVHNVGFVNNEASVNGGALLTVGADLAVRHVTFDANRAPSGSHVTAFNGNVAEWSNSVMGPVGDGSGPACASGSAATVAVGNVGAAGIGCDLILPGIVTVADLRILGVDDGAAMPVVVFERDSAAIDGADAARCLPEDARGNARPQDGNHDGVVACDAGAYEAPQAAIFGDGFED